MPVEMGHNVAKRGEIHFVGAHDRAHRSFGFPHGVHQTRTLIRRKVRHFADVPVEDDTTNSRIIRFICQNDSAPTIIPE